MDRVFLSGLSIFKSISGFLTMLSMTLVPVLTAAGVQEAETIGKSARGSRRHKAPSKEFGLTPPRFIAAFLTPNHL